MSKLPDASNLFLGKKLEIGEKIFLPIGTSVAVYVPIKFSLLELNMYGELTLRSYQGYHNGETIIGTMTTPPSDSDIRNESISSLFSNIKSLFYRTFTDVWDRDCEKYLLEKIEKKYPKSQLEGIKIPAGEYEIMVIHKAWFGKNKISYTDKNNDPDYKLGQEVMLKKSNGDKSSPEIRVIVFSQ